MKAFKKSMVVMIGGFLLISLFPAIIGLAQAQPPLDYPQVSIAISGRNVIFDNENVSISFRTTNVTQIGLRIYQPNGSLEYSGLRNNSTFSYAPNTYYGKWVVIANVSTIQSETWFWMQDISNMSVATLPQSWVWQGVNYTLSANYTLRAKLGNVSISTEWLDEFFVKLKPDITTIQMNDQGLIRIFLSGKNIKADSWLMNTAFGMKIRVNGTLAKLTTLKWNYKATSSEILWGNSRLALDGGSSNLIYDYSDMDIRSIGVSYNLDKTGEKLDVYLQKEFDVDPTFLTDGFESGDYTGGWTGTTTSGGTATVDTNEVHQGTYSSEITVSSSNDIAFSYYTPSSAQADVYTRFYIRFSAFGTSGQDMFLLSYKSANNDAKKLARVTVWVNGSGAYWLLQYLSGF